MKQKKNNAPVQKPEVKQPWSKPQLIVMSVRSNTLGPTGSGTDGNHKHS